MKQPHYEKSIGENPFFRKFTYLPETSRWCVGPWEDIDPEKMISKDGIIFFKIEDVLDELSK